MTQALRPHPFVSKNGVDCDWCPLPKGNRVHLLEPTQWESDSHSLVTGLVMSALLAGLSDILTAIEPIHDANGDYTNIIRVTTRSGKKFDVTVTSSP